MPRYHRVEDIIQLALALQAPGPGLCLEDIQQRFEVGRRTAERMREAVDRLYPGMTSTKGADGRKYWSLPAGCANGLVSWQAEEIRALDDAIAESEAAGHAERARTLAAVRDKVGALADPSVQGEASGRPVAPLKPLPRAILEDREVSFRLVGPDGTSGEVLAHPYGMLGGSRQLLVAYHPDRGRACLHPVEALSEVTARTNGFERDPTLDMRRFAANAFVPLEDGPVQACWRFAGEAAEEALGYAFHESQEIEQRADGSVVVRFDGASLVELAWHLFTWGDRIETIEPPILKHRFEVMMRRAMEARALGLEPPSFEHLDG